MNELRKSVSKALILLDAGKISSLVARDQIFAAFKAHISLAPLPENPITDKEIEDCEVEWEKAALAQHQVGFGIGIEADRKKLMESLE